MDVKQARELMQAARMSFFDEYIEHIKAIIGDRANEGFSDLTEMLERPPWGWVGIGYIVEALKEEGFTVEHNVNDDGGMEVKHLHLHLIGGQKLGRMA